MSCGGKLHPAASIRFDPSVRGPSNHQPLPEIHDDFGSLKGGVSKRLLPPCRAARHVRHHSHCQEDDTRPQGRPHAVPCDCVSTCGTPRTPVAGASIPLSARKQLFSLSPPLSFALIVGPLTSPPPLPFPPVLPSPFPQQ